MQRNLKLHAKMEAKLLNIKSVPCKGNMLEYRPVSVIPSFLATGRQLKGNDTVRLCSYFTIGRRRTQKKKGKQNQSNELLLVECVPRLRLNDNDNTHPIVYKWVCERAAKQKECREINQ